MNKQYVPLITLSLLLVTTLNISPAPFVNSLTAKLPHSTQLSLTFKDHTDYNTKWNPKDLTLTLNFANAQKERKDNIPPIPPPALISSCTQLKELSVITDYSFETSPEGPNDIKVIFKIPDVPILIKFYPIKNSSIFILEFYTRDNINYINSRLNNYLPSPQEHKKPKNFLIIIDPGHGGQASGACYWDQKEKNINLDIALKLKETLIESGYNVFLTRDKDTDVSLYQRALSAHEQNGVLFISLHSNANGKGIPFIYGTETYYLNTHELCSTQDFSGVTFSTPKLTNTNEWVKTIDYWIKINATHSNILASIVHKSLIRSLEEHKHTYNDRGVKTDHFVVLRANTVPAILVEVGYVSNYDECMRLQDPTFQEDVAQGICDGICTYISGITHDFYKYDNTKVSTTTNAIPTPV
jgi:N-acetylmuramoyl-L-alanine amidase